MNIKKLNLVGCDFDATLVVHEYPNIGAIIPGAFETLKWLQDNGVNIILITMRSGRELKEAVDLCKEHGITFYAVNDNPSQKSWTSSRKIYVEKMIDDNSVGAPLIDNGKDMPYIDWNKIKEILKPIVEIED
jgi:hydroxymethylpyrimidine pyrophosphatase-like HAD family hydrolase